MTQSTENPKINIIEFPKDFQITPEFIEKTDNIHLLNLSISNVQSNSLIKSLIQTKIKVLTTLNNPDQSYITLAATEKDTGNILMKSKNYLEAILHYTYSIIYNPKESATYCNRALAYINTSNYMKGISDCTSAIILNPKYIKAYYRRAICYSKLKKYQMALEDLLYLINTKNGTKEIESEIDLQLNQFKQDIGKDNWELLKNDITQKINDAKKQALSSNSFSWNLSQEQQEKYNNWTQASINAKKDLDNMIKNKSFEKALELIQVCYTQSEKFINGYNEKTVEHYNIYKAMYELNIMKILVDYKQNQKIKEINEKKKQLAKANIIHDRLYKTTILSKEQRDKATKIAEEDIKFSDYANSSYGFERAYNSFKNRLDLFYQFLIYFKGKKLAEIYQNSEIPIAVLNGIISTLKEKFNDINNNTELFFDYLVSITKSKSFGLVKNFIKKKDKLEIEKMLIKISELDATKKEDCEKVIQLYK